MKKQKIFYIDDQSFALPQLIGAIPEYVDYELIYVQRIEDIVDDEYDLVILDFYLNKDEKTALDIVERFQGMMILSFSTAKSKNRLMLENWAIYAVEKLSGTNANQELKEIMENIFPKT